MRFHAIGRRDDTQLLSTRSSVVERSDLAFYHMRISHMRSRRVAEYVLAQVTRETQRRSAQAGRRLLDWVEGGLWWLQKQELQRKKKRRV